MLSHRRPVSETPFKWRFAGGQMIARFVFLIPLYPHQLIKEKSQGSCVAFLISISNSRAFNIGVPFKCVLWVCNTLKMKKKCFNRKCFC